MKTRLPVLKVAVVGHTNTGKTSLLRTLMRDAAFGEVSNRPATTRHVEGAALLVDGAPVIELYDTPGLEDSIGLLEHLDNLAGDARVDGIELIERFLAAPAAGHGYQQEAKALRQVLAGDAVLYIVDARDRVLAKYRDELEILARSAKPVVPVLNFVASSQARTGEWREHLARLNLHAVVAFDTVVFDEYGERRLFEKMQTLLDRFQATLDALIADRAKERARLNKLSAELLAETLIDVAAYVVTVSEDDTTETAVAMEALKHAVRQREQQCVDALLELHRFRLDDYTVEALPIDEGQWGLDLFSPESMQQFGIQAGGGAAAGGMAGLAIDAMAGGATLGAAAALGATLGALLTSARTHGRRLAERMRGVTELRASDATVRLLALRQMELVEALLRRGHASQGAIEAKSEAHSAVGNDAWRSARLPAPIGQARAHPGWSRLGDSGSSLDAGRKAAKDELAELIEGQLKRDGTSKD